MGMRRGSKLHGEIFTLSLTLNRAQKSEVRQQTHKCFYPVLTLFRQGALFVTPFGKPSLSPFGKKGGFEEDVFSL